MFQNHISFHQASFNFETIISPPNEMSYQVFDCTHQEGLVNVI